MPNFQATSEEETLVEAVRAFASEKITPIALEIDNRSERPSSLLDGLHRMGLYQPVPEQHGGQGELSTMAHLLVTEELSRADAGLAFTVAMSALPVRLIAAAGSAPAQAEVLRAAASDSALRVATLLFEGYGRAPAEWTTAAERRGSELRVSGAKVGATWPEGAQRAMAFALDPDTRQLSAFLVDPAAVVVQRDDQVAGKLGARSAQTGNVLLDQAPATRVLDPSADPAAVADYVEEARLAVAAILLGSASAALDYAMGYARERVAFGQPIAEYQGVSFPLVELRMRLDAARLAVLGAAHRVGAGDATLSADVSQAVAYCSNVALDATRLAINTLGGHGFLQDHPVERWYRAATTLSALSCDPLLLELEVL